MIRSFDSLIWLAFSIGFTLEVVAVNRPLHGHLDTHSVFYQRISLKDIERKSNNLMNYLLENLLP
jgi:hypothetical protein